MGHGCGISIKTISDNKHMLRWRDSNGIDRQQYVYGTREFAEKTRTEALIASGKIKVEETTFDELAAEYLRSMAHTKSYRGIQYVFKQLSDEFAGWKISQFIPLAVERYQSKLRAKGNMPATINVKIVYLRAMIAAGVRWKMCSRDILLDVKEVKRIPIRNKRIKHLSDAEVETLLKACTKSTNKELYSVVLIAMNTGMRKMEIANLEWNRIDMTNREILVNNTKSGKDRIVPINDTIYKLLAKMNTVRRIDGKLFNAFPKKAWEFARVRAGLPDFHFHDLRHHFATKVRMSGCDLAVLQQLLGHAEIAMTMRYAHVGETEKATAVRVLDRAINL